MWQKGRVTKRAKEVRWALLPLPLFLSFPSSNCMLFLSKYRRRVRESSQRSRQTNKKKQIKIEIKTPPFTEFRPSLLCVVKDVFSLVFLSFLKGRQMGRGKWQREKREGAKEREPKRKDEKGRESERARENAQATRHSPSLISRIPTVAGVRYGISIHPNILISIRSN